MSDPVTIAAGKIQFYDFYKPRLAAGAYKVEVQQTIDTTNTVDYPDVGIKRSEIQRTFHVTAPRFRLGPNDVHAVYPPANSQGSFHQTLPHIVLRQRTLPWTRPLDQNVAADDDNPLPWLALLLFSEHETPTRETKKIGADIVNNNNGPSLELEAVDDREALAYTIDISASLFKAIAPGLDDLPLLSHVRQVNTGDKELLGLAEDGWFSVVVCNRIPQAGVNTVHLVSLEGWRSFLNGSRNINGNVRLVSLASWSFTAVPDRGSFQELMGEIKNGLLRVELPQKMRQSSDTATRLVATAVDAGYVPLNYETWRGEKTAGWYRGPLLPVKVPREDKDPYESAEAALIYDPRTGLFDASYAVAWQLGRLLALADGGFAAALQRWRLEGNRMLDRLLENLDLADKFATGELFGFKQLDELEKLTKPIEATSISELDLNIENLPPDLKTLIEDLSATPVPSPPNPAGEDETTGSPAGETEVQDKPDINDLVTLVENYLKKIINDVKQPQSRSNTLFEKVIKDKIQKNLLVPENSAEAQNDPGDQNGFQEPAAALASAPIDKAELMAGLPELTADQEKEIREMATVAERADLIRKVLLADIIPPGSF